MKKALTELGKFYKRNGAVAILDNAKLENGYLTITDLESSISVKVDKPGTGLIPFEELKKIGSKFDVDFSFVGEQVIMTCGNKTFKTVAGEFEEYPITPEATGEPLFTLVMNKELRSLQNFIGKDEMRISMMGVSFNKTEIAATNAYVLKWIEAAGPETAIILPPALFKVIDGEYQVYASHLGAHTVVLVSEDITYSLRLIDAMYPQYDVVIPKDNPITFSIGRKELIAELEAALMMANPTTKQVQFDLAKHTLSAFDLDFSREYVGGLPIAAMTGEIDRFVIGFNGDFLTTCLKNIEAEIVTFAMSAPNRATLINDTTLIMPVR